MPLSSVSQKFVDDFFAAIAPFEKAFGHAGFSYLAVRLGKDFVLLRGRLFLNLTPSEVPPPHFRSPNVRAGHYKLAELGLDVQGLIERLCVGNYTGRRVAFSRRKLYRVVCAVSS